MRDGIDRCGDGGGCRPVFIGTRGRDTTSRRGSVGLEWWRELVAPAGPVEAARPLAAAGVVERSAVAQIGRPFRAPHDTCRRWRVRPAADEALLVRADERRRVAPCSFASQAAMVGWIRCAATVRCEPYRLWRLEEGSRKPIKNSFATYPVGKERKDNQARANLFGA